MNTTIIIPGSVYIGYIIGRDGRTIRSIEERTKTKIRWPYKSNPTDRKFTIYGFGSHGAADVDKAVDEILQLVNGRLAAMDLHLLEKRQLILPLAGDTAASRQTAPVAQKKRYISDDDFVEILRWLRRFDLDAPQITSRKLRRLIEDNQMPRRHLFDVSIGRSDTSGNPHVLVRPYERPGAPSPPVLSPDVDAAAAYLSYAFIEKFCIDCYPNDDPPILPRRELLTAPDEHIKEIQVAGTHADFSQAGVLEEAICVCRFEQFSVYCHDMPDWQVSDDFLRRLGRSGCAKVDLTGLICVSPTNSNFVVTDDGILDYCFSSDLGALGSRQRTLWIDAGVSIGTTFFKKCIQAHFESRVMTRMELELHKGDQVCYELSGFLEHLTEYTAYRLDLSEEEIGYDIPDQGDDMRLLLTLQSIADSGYLRSRLIVRRGHKNDEAFFLRPFAF